MVDEKQLKIDKCGFVPRQYHARYLVGHTSVLRRMRWLERMLSQFLIVCREFWLYCGPTNGIPASQNQNQWDSWTPAQSELSTCEDARPIRGPTHLSYGFRWALKRQALFSPIFCSNFDCMSVELASYSCALSHMCCGAKLAKNVYWQSNVLTKVYVTLLSLRVFTASSSRGQEFREVW